ncbi:MFS transporter [Aerococcaceae bacterium zg-ZUI334]|uniref:MFS transporter n=1 Tax=Aerococcaceae TaxID=186827 RepID=UPI0013B5EBE5|nr:MULTISPECIES: MFS transporter [unclassified Facklamia]MBR7927107.1 MFS transporter [Aerococcaceae bacterium zg-ZUI334]MBS4461901.1 MFS transporter [Aerococcaceae bacterium zg-B36]QQD66416.1 MFS transporter [Aerococcaceae bacterium zg-252]NEW63565.1 MFS transporter [Facklamia sp. 252]NEW67036.1 MFS transporter [Facklamia sp. 253]
MIHLLLVTIYLAFISLGLPDSLLGSAWPIMNPMMNVPLSFAGIVSMIISCGTIISSLQSDRVTKRFGAGKVTVFSVLLTAIALFGFSVSSSFWQLCLWAIPYGLGAGSIDASLNNFVALHYKSHHMSWLHCMWGLGAAIGPYIMTYALTHELGWQGGYWIIGIIQAVLTFILFMSLPLWKSHHAIVTKEMNTDYHPLSLKQIMAIKGTKEIMISFLAYCAIESIVGLWASSYFVLYKGIPEGIAASYAALFYIGITVGRALSGFLTFKFSDEQMIKIGSSVIFLGIFGLLVPKTPDIVSLISVIIIGFGCAPIYPSIIHMSPRYFGKGRSQAIIGVQMASAYLGTLVMPPIFGWLGQGVGMWILPFFILVIAIIMVIMIQRFIQLYESEDTTHV